MNRFEIRYAYKSDLSHFKVPGVNKAGKQKYRGEKKRVKSTVSLSRKRDGQGTLVSHIIAQSYIMEEQVGLVHGHLFKITSTIRNINFFFFYSYEIINME